MLTINVTPTALVYHPQAPRSSMQSGSHDLYMSSSGGSSIIKSANLVGYLIEGSRMSLAHPTVLWAALFAIINKLLTNIRKKETLFGQ